MKGNKFVVSGFRDKKLEEDINQRGGKLTTSVSGNTTGIIVVSKGGKLTGKVEKASQLGIPIYTKEEFKKKYNIE
jgi:NAD-dependent DNA ligase